MTGVDHVDQPLYDHEFVVSDVFDFDLTGFDLVVASPPCQCYSNSWAKTKHKHRSYPDLLAKTREYIERFQVPYIIENVQGATSVMRDPVKCCGTMFGLQVFRHRMFEFGGGIVAPNPLRCAHKGKRCNTPSWRHGNMWTVCGTGGGWGSIAEWKRAMGIDWMDNRRSLSQAIPPAYTEWVGQAARSQL